MSTEIKIIERELKKLIARIKSKSKQKDIDKSEFFKSEDGRNFCRSYTDLEEFITNATFIPAAMKSSKKFFDFFLSGNLFNYIKKNVDQNDANQKRELSKFEELYKKFMELIDEIDENITVEQEEEKEKEEDWETAIKNLKILPRVIDYFVLTLYTYFDVYSMSLIRKVVAESPVENIFEITSSFNKFRDPKETIKILLQKLTFNHVNLNTILDETYKKEGWGNIFNALSALKELRNQIAHKKPLTSPEDLEKRFKQESKYAKKNTEKIIRDLKKQDIPVELLNMFESLYMDLKTFLLVVELGNSCFRYIACVDNIIVNFFKIQSN